ncbi:MAG: T9SS type A sorting domain-containing protein, partial [Cytophagaceae bacterium]
NLATAATTTSGGTTALTTACSSTSIYLSLSGLSTQTGYTFQWQSSLNGGTTWTNIAGATSATYTATGQTAATSYRAQIGCLNAGTTLTTSTPVQIAQNPFYNCYCTPVTSGLGSDGITNVTLGTLTSTSSTTNTSPYYTDYSAAQTAGTLATPSVFSGSTVSVSVTMGSDTRQYSGVWIDFDHSSTFDTGEFFTLGTDAGANGTSVIPVAIPATALAGLTKMRVRGGDDVVLLNTQSCTASSSASNYGEVEDYLVTIVAPVACTGTPPAITATASATTACAGAGITLTAAGPAAGTTGLSYQWQSKLATATTFANLGTAQTTATYTVASQTAATDYRVIVTCTASALSATSNTVSVAQTPFANCYCTILSTGTNEYIKGVTLPGAPGFTNTTGVNSTNGYGDFTANAAYTTTLARGTTYNNLSVTVRSNSTGSQGGMWIDYDHSGTFDASEYTLVGSSNLTATDVTFPVTLVVPATALAGPTRMRVRWRNSAFTSADACVSNAAAGCTAGCAWFGETEDYLVTVSATPLATSAANAAAKLALFPNPTQTTATLTGADAGTTVQVLDVLSRVVLSVKADASGKATLQLPAGAAKGVYLVRAGQLTTRLVLE